MNAPRLDVVYAARVQPGDVVLGRVERDAPTRPVQPFAAGMTVERVERVETGDGKRYVFRWVGGLSSSLYRVDAQVMVLAGARFGESSG